MLRCDRFRLSCLLSCLGTLACGDGEATFVHARLRSENDCNALGTPSNCAAPAAELCHDRGNADPSVLFGWPAVPTVALRTTQENWQQLLANPLSEQYVSAEMDFEERPVGTVGLRFKGDWGTLNLCLDETGKLKCPKLSMKIGFAEFDATCRFFGTKHLNLHSMQWDPSHLHERLSYELFREMGIVAPLSAWANVTVNGASLGLFSMVEDIDARFVDNRWGQHGGGDLYKEAWPKSADPDYYAGLLQTNEDTADPTPFVRFHRELASAPDDPASLAIALGHWSDLTYLRRYLAVDDALVNWDGITTTYIAEDDSWSRNHNYYWYKEPDRDYFWLIPWDLDGTLVPTKAVVDAPPWSAKPEDCSVKYPEFGDDIWVLAPGCDRVFRALSADMSVYHAAVDALLSGPFSQTLLREKIARYRDFIASAARADPHLAPEAWQNAVAVLMDSVPLLRERLTRLRDGLSVNPFLLRTDQANDFAQASTFEMAVGASSYSNPSSSAHAALLQPSDVDPSAPRIRLDFGMCNEVAAWGQWVKLGLSLAGSPVDLSALTGVRLFLRSDKPRVLRIEVRSPAQSRSSAGVQLGWDRVALDYWSTVEVKFVDAGLTNWVKLQGLDPSDPPSAVWATISGLEFLPGALGRNGDGQLPAGKIDYGFLELGLVEFF